MHFKQHPGLSLQDASRSTTLLAVTTKNVPRHCPVSPEGKLSWLRTIRVGAEPAHMGPWVWSRSIHQPRSLGGYFWAPPSMLVRRHLSVQLGDCDP